MRQLRQLLRARLRLRQLRRMRRTGLRLHKLLRALLRLWYRLFRERLPICRPVLHRLLRKPCSHLLLPRLR